MSLTTQDKKDIEAIVDTKVSKAVEDLAEVINILAQNMHNEIMQLKQDNIKIQNSLDRLTNTIDSFVKRLDDAETEQAARDLQFEKLLAWAKEVSKKTGVPLKNL